MWGWAVDINNQKWKVKVTQSCPTLWDLMDYTQKERKWSCSVMSESLRPHGWVACTRLFCPWDFLGKSTGVGCYFLLQGIFPTQGSNPGLLHCRQMLYRLSHQGSHHGLYSSRNFPAQNTGVCSLFFSRGPSQPSQWSNLGLQHCRQMLYQLSHKGSPRIPEWVAYPFSSGS